MAATLVPTARRFLLTLACLSLPLTASAQEVPVDTDDQILTASQVGQSISVPVRVSNLGAVADVESYTIDIGFPTGFLTFEEFATAGTLTDASDLSVRQTDPEDANANGAARIVAAALSGNAEPINAQGDGGVLFEIVFTVDAQSSGTVELPPSGGAFDLEGGDVAVDLTDADLEVDVRELLSVSEARAQGPGTSVAVEAVVTRAFGASLRFQDDSGPTGASALTIRQESGPLSDRFQDDIQSGTIARGTRLRVAGVLSESGGLLLIRDENLDSYSVEGQGLAPVPQEVSFFELEGPDGEGFESELIRAGGVSFTDPDATGGILEAETTYEVEDPDGTTFDYRVGSASETGVIGAEIPEGTFTYEGVLGQDNGGSGADEGYRLVPVHVASGLPVELAGFTATATETGALLQWRTASETGNAGFEVQHRPPGAEVWERLGFVESSAGGGTTSTPQSYRFETEPLSPGAHRFRLRQVDLGGGGALSSAVRLEVRTDRALTLTTVGASPARQSARLAFTTRQGGDVRMSLYNTLGQRVRRLPARQARAGKRYEVNLPVRGLPSGTYFARLLGPTGTRAKKIVVVR